MNISVTKHCRERMEFRKIATEEIIDILFHPDTVRKKQGKYYYAKKTTRGNIEVCCEQTENNINIITVYWK
ncbi:MAG: DUF4258 domain-containing protein [Nanoarchaeota archaeon]|nr:DUF4258 domain-containing protein [Nanoarchaeota archaeon]